MARHGNKMDAETTPGKAKGRKTEGDNRF